MQRRLTRSLFAALFVIAAGTRGYAQPQPNAVVIFETEKGMIELEVDGVHAPASAANFLKYVDAGFYDGGSVNRAVRPDNTVRHDVEIQVIQFQIDPARRTEQFPPIPLERTSVTGLTHVDGAISMARGATADSASSDFFLCVGEQPSLDFGGGRAADGQGFAAFGRVTSGMDVVRKIQTGATNNSEALLAPVVIARIHRK